MRMGVPRTYVSKIENEKATPTLSSLARLADGAGGDACPICCADCGPSREDEIASCWLIRSSPSCWSSPRS